MKSIEQRIGYKFRNSLLLAEALTHPSLAYETHKPHFDNQRLEFLGDAVLQLILTAELYQRFPQFAEGTMTKLRSRLVSRDALHGYSLDIDLGKFLLIGKGEESSGGRQRPSTLADAFEALVGAIYLDTGIDEAKEFILHCCQAKMERIATSPIEKNPKGELQEILQGLSQLSPTYEVVSSSGPDHKRNFIIDVLWETKPLGRGTGCSKKEAEANAARNALVERTWEKSAEKNNTNDAPSKLIPKPSTGGGVTAGPVTELLGEKR